MKQFVGKRHKSSFGDSPALRRLKKYYQGKNAAKENVFKIMILAQCISGHNPVGQYEILSRSFLNATTYI